MNYDSPILAVSAGGANHRCMCCLLASRFPGISFADNFGQFWDRTAIRPKTAEAVTYPDYQNLVAQYQGEFTPSYSVPRIIAGE